MKDNIFLDTNILIYLYSEDEIDKQNISKSLVADFNPTISIQVLSEISNVFMKKMGLNVHIIFNVRDELLKSCSILLQLRFFLVRVLHAFVEIFASFVE
ncbi:MAG: PIN domain-containing protein [bacterium]